MSTTSRNRLLLSCASWALLLALLPATPAFDGFAPGPFLLATLLLSALSGAGGALIAGGRASRRAEGAGRGWAAASGIWASQGIGAVALSALSIWLAQTVTMRGFSPAVPGRVFSLLGDPGVLLQSALAALVVLGYAVFAGILLSQLVGSAVLRLVREEGGSASRGGAGDGRRA